jgi:hypothetical protein
VHRREVGEVGEGHGRVGVEVQQLLGRHVREAAAALAGGLAMSEKRSAPTRSGSVSSATSWMATWTGTPGGGTRPGALTSAGDGGRRVDDGDGGV